jgi:hypothetical protein
MVSPAAARVHTPAGGANFCVDPVAGSSDAVPVLVTPSERAGEPSSDVGRSGANGYEHLAPLFAELTVLPVDHPRRGRLRSELIIGYLPVRSPSPASMPIAATTWTTSSRSRPSA